ncbi:MAG: hypothetical protein IPM32_14885 [Ignavibacteriae bacterium]|nr:hypothetical protein [Ignavibacteriota bacterium]
MKVLSVFLAIIILSTLFISCRDEDELIAGSPINIDLPEYDNIPVIANINNNFVLTLNAKNFNYNYNDYLYFTNDSLVISITNSRSSSSNSDFILFDNLNEEIFSENFNTDKVVVKDNLGGKVPARIKIKLENYTGMLNIVVAVKD